MSWARLDDDLIDHPKWVAIMSAARESCDSRAEARAMAKNAGMAWLGALVWGCRVNCDGVVPESAAPTIAPRVFLTEDEFIDAAPLLVKAGLWHALTKSTRKLSCGCVMDSANLAQRPGWVIHDFADYQKAKQQVEMVEDHKARMKRLYGTKAGQKILAAVKARDMDRCRYCWVEVKWSARRGASAATIDHVDPSGQNAVKNCVVACRSCNARKGNRTPEEAEMPLLKPYFSLEGTDDPDLSVSTRVLFANSSRLIPAEGSGRARSTLDGAGLAGSGREASASRPSSSGVDDGVVVVDLNDEEEWARG